MFKRKKSGKYTAGVHTHLLLAYNLWYHWRGFAFAREGVKCRWWPQIRTPVVTNCSAGVQIVRQRYLLPLAWQHWRTLVRQQ